MFNIGDLVTGKDRSYKRSIYEVISITGDTCILRFVCLNGQLGTKKDTSERLIKDFRLATHNEVFHELGFALGYNLIGFVRTLLKTKRSSLVRL